LAAAFCGMVSYGSFLLNPMGAIPSESLREWRAFVSGADTAALTFWIVFPITFLFPPPWLIVGAPEPPNFEFWANIDR
jgi:hypothetical protein